ncbi:hypothetical protein T06_16197 [Trichinella sp. T6]|nr:hypothetical protein T06_16197 [Trichinella sp. T6]
MLSSCSLFKYCTFESLSCKKRNHCFVNKLLSGDVQISEKNILAQDTGSLNQEQIRYILRQAND